MNQFKPYLPILEKTLHKLDMWRRSYGVEGMEEAISPDQIEDILVKLAKRLEGNYPFHHPQYAGQMLKPPHPAAWLAYALTMTVNPNNHALDGGPPTSEMEKETVAKLAAMIGYTDGYLGHLTSGGTIANLEALYVAREIHPGKKIAASASAHYTHKRMCRVLNTPFLEIPVDSDGLPDKKFIEIHAGEIGTLVVTMGTTGLGVTEPLKDLIQLAHLYDFRIHADAAYGGFYKVISESLPGQVHWDALAGADSIVIDPHKHGLQPYGCGSVLYKNAAAGQYFKHDSPYTYFTSDELHLGEISLECSRAGASAAALWATLELLPLTENGIGRVLSQTRHAACTFGDLIQKSTDFELYRIPDLDIVGYFAIPGEKRISDMNRLSQSLFDKGMQDREGGFHLSLYKVSAAEFCEEFPEYTSDADNAVLLRSVFMKPEHAEFS
ncbi:MAG: aminotransferase class V-fold PLP-dependent enzyme, partial [Balneolaceae bacterium]